MGCGGSKGVQYEFEGKKHTIPNDKANTIKKVSLASIAKLKMKVQIIRKTKAITSKQLLFGNDIVSYLFLF